MDYEFEFLLSQPAKHGEFSTYPIKAKVTNPKPYFVSVAQAKVNFK